MDYTITYGSLKSITYRFHGHEVWELLQQKAEKHAQKTIRPSATVSWDMNWWDDEDSGRLVVELVCEIKSEIETEADHI